MERSGKPYSSSEVENNTKRAEKLVKKLNAEGFVEINEHNGFVHLLGV